MAADFEEEVDVPEEAIQIIDENVLRGGPDPPLTSQSPV